MGQFSGAILLRAQSFFALGKWRERRRPESLYRVSNHCRTAGGYGAMGGPQL